MHLTFSCSQFDLEETQVDGPDDMYGEEEMEEGIKVAEVLVANSPERTYAETQLDDELDELKTAYFPENSRFDTPRHLPHLPSSATKKTPTPGPGHNPLANINFVRGAIGGRPHMSLSQMFETTSSPVRPSTAGASLPPTPSKAQLEQVMAASLSRLPSRSGPLAEHLPYQSPSILEKRGKSKSVADPMEVYVSMKESQEERERGARRRPAGARHANRRTPRSVSPTIFSSSVALTQRDAQPEPEKDRASDSDDCMTSASAERKRRAALARKEADEEVKRAFSAVKIPKGNETGRRSKTKEPQRKQGKRRAEKTSKSQGLPGGAPGTGGRFTTDEEGEGTAAITTLRADTRGESEAPDESEVRLPIGRARASRNSSAPPNAVMFTSDIPSDLSVPSPKGKNVDVSAPNVPQTQQESTFDWEGIHRVEPLRFTRRTKPAPTAPQEHPYSRRHQGAYPLTTANYQPPVPGLARQGSSVVKTSLRNLPPFNIPSPVTTPSKKDAARDVPEFVQETSNLEAPSSGLLAPTSSLTPVPSVLSSPPRGVQTSSPPPPFRDVPETPFPAQAITLNGMRNGATTIPETSPWEREGMMTPVPPIQTSQSAPATNVASQSLRGNARESTQDGSPVRGKRKRNSAEKPFQQQRRQDGEVVPKPVLGNQELARDGMSTMRGFAAVENSGSLFSSRPEPDDVDMVGLVADLETEEAGRDAIMEPPSKRPKAADRGPGDVTPMASKSLQKSASGLGGGPGPSKLREGVKAPRRSTGRVSTKDRPSAVAARKTRSSASLRDFTASMTDSLCIPAAALSSEDELESNNPAFSVSVSAPAPDPTVVSPERVFALFKDTKMYYHPATVLSTNTRGSIKVVFDDGTEDVLDDRDVRSLDLRVTDVVKVDLPAMKKDFWVIVGLNAAPEEDAAYGGRSLTDIRGHTSIYVKPKGATRRASDLAEGEEAVEVPVTKIYLIKKLWAQFAKRPSQDLNPRTRQMPLGVTSPSAGGNAHAATVTPGTPSKMRRNTPVSAKHGGIFSTMVFALSFGDKEAKKRSIAYKIVSNDGRIVDPGFEELFEDIERNDLSTRPETASVGFACVVADKHSRRAKFLQGLALGLPCLAGRWVEDCVKAHRLLEWGAYLLPAGESSYLDGAIRSRTIRPFPAAEARFEEMVAGRRKLLENLNVVLVSGKAAGAAERRVCSLASPQQLSRCLVANNGCRRHTCS